jgi:hypothetical protein
MTTTSLPEGFTDLEPWVAEWALPTEEQRYHRLLAQSIDQVRAFYDAMLPRAPQVIEYLSRFPLDGIAGSDRVLHDLLLTFVETAHPIELKWRQTDIDSPVEAARLRFHGPSATPAP